jgi:hypothetical protein
MGRLQWLVFVGFIALTACSGGGISGTCDCPGGQTCVDGVCKQICNDFSQCGQCEGCVDGACEAAPSCNADDCQCSNDQVCFAGDCFEPCADGTCSPGATCVSAEGIQRCVPDGDPSGFKVVGGVAITPVQTSSGGNFVVRGGAAVCGEPVASDAFRVTAPLE